MDPIPVPAPPKSSFNKNRCVSDLLLSQLKHFQHLAHKQGIELDPAPEHDIYTEGGAARYIAGITRIVRGISQQSSGKPVLAARTASGPARQLPATIDLAAEAATTSPASDAKVSKAPRTSRNVKPSKKI